MRLRFPHHRLHLWVLGVILGRHLHWLGLLGPSRLGVLENDVRESDLSGLLELLFETRDSVRELRMVGNVRSGSALGWLFYK